MIPIFTTEFVWTDAVIVPGTMAIPVNYQDEKMVFEGSKIDVNERNIC